MVDKCVSYKKQVVAFIDILGYKQIISKIHNEKNKEKINEEKAIKVINLLNDVVRKNIINNVDTAEFPDDYGAIKYKIFSDCICLCSDCVEPYEDYYSCNFLYDFLKSIIKIQMELIKQDIKLDGLGKGIFIRGAVTINSHYQNDNLIFSNALVNAYSKESKMAIYPRILVDESIIKVFRKYIDETDDDVNYGKVNEIIKISPDGLKFLDYLGYYTKKDRGIEEFLYIHKDAIEDNLKKIKDSHVIKKYLWLANYHNYKIDEINGDYKSKVEQKLITFRNNIFDVWFMYVYKLNKDENYHKLAIIKAPYEEQAENKLYKRLNLNTEYDKNSLIVDAFVVKYSEETVYREEVILRNEYLIEKDNIFID